MRAKSMIFNELDEVCISFYPGLSAEYLNSLADEKSGSEAEKSEKASWSYRSELDEHEVALVD